MPPARKPVPSYLPHTQSGRARAVWTDVTGVRRQKLLPGPFDSPESRAAFATLLAELAASPATAAAHRDGITVAEVLLAYHRFAEGYYVDPDGRPTKELLVLKYALRPVRDLYADTPAAAFGPLALKAVRQSMIEAGLSRGLINRRVGAVKRAFKWAVSEELIPSGVSEALRTVPGLRQGRTSAREAQPVAPVEDAVDATLPHLSRHVRAMVELMRHTGMRPGEVCAMTLGQIDRAGEVWTYRPNRHKTAHHGKMRAIPLGPKAKDVLAAFLAVRAPDPDAPLFSPVASRE
ncbi:MAG: tyrosine-type recombinase/integrase, partial [Gemmataceae bacterium]|nr:tyrosine-type recombinase/integrase [Gemmataceae bacterium]